MRQSAREPHLMSLSNIDRVSMEIAVSKFGKNNVVNDRALMCAARATLWQPHTRRVIL